MSSFLEMPNQPVSKAIKIVGKPAGLHGGWSRKQVLELEEGFKKHPSTSTDRLARAAGYKHRDSWDATLHQTKVKEGVPRKARVKKPFGPKLQANPNYTYYGKTGRPARYNVNRVDLGKVSKTFIPGKGYVSATKLPKSQLRMTVRTQRAAKARVRDEEARHFQAYRKTDQSQKELLAEIGQKGKELPSPMKGTAFLQPNWAKEAQMKSVNIEAFAVKRGGRRSGQAVMVVPKGATKDTVNHEMAHLTPKRSGYRLHQVLNDSKKLMREEGRAEMATRSKGGYYKTDAPGTSGYIQMARDDDIRSAANFQDKMMRGDILGEGKYNKEALEAFRGVQDKIYRARSAKGAPFNSGGGSEKFRGNQYVDDKKRRKVRAGLVALGGGTAAGGGGYSAYRWNKKRSTK